MSTNELEKEFEIRNLRNKIINLNMQLKNANKKINAKTINEVDSIDKKYKKEIIFLRKQISIKEDLQQRLEKKINKQEDIINEKNAVINEKNAVINEKDEEILALKMKLIEQAKKLDLTKEERDKYLAQLNLDGTTAGIPTSMTPINKKKIIPNTREKSEKAKGGQVGHQKHKLEVFKDEEINEKEEIKLTKCPKCGNEELKELEKDTTKDELDYEIKIIKKRYYFKEYECSHCHSTIRANIPNNLKEDNQYGNKVQAHALTLTNIANVPFNKTRRIISGLSSNEINLSEGYICKLQKRASNMLEGFIEELYKYILTLYVVHWDDAVIFVNTKRACLRFYGDNC